MSNKNVHPIFAELFDNMAKIFSPPATPGHANDCKHNVLRMEVCTCGHLPEVDDLEEETKQREHDEWIELGRDE